MLHAVTKKQGWIAINPPYAILDGEAEVAEVHYAPASRRGQVIADGLTYDAYSQLDFCHFPRCKTPGGVPVLV